MVLVAHIIVDVPLMQTDRPYSYLVPEAMQEQIAIGMRVHVPFGKGNRLLQGFIIGLEEQENLRDFPELKPIAELLDYEPVLNQEQLDLADQMRHTVFSYKISILKSMLPGLLNSQYDKVIMATDKLGEEEKATLLQGQNHILFSQLSEVQRQAIPRLVQSGHVTVDYLAKDKQNIKTEKHYSVQKGILETLAISQRAKKRLELRDFLLEKSGSGKLTDLHKLFSRDVVKFFIEAGALVITEVEVNRADSYFEKVEKTDFLELNAQQAHAVEEMTCQIGQAGKPFLLEGVTGSGKTEVYLHLIERTLAMEKTAIVLVPEISLTPQMTNRFISRFGDLVAIMHSGLSDGEKFDEWRKVKSGQAKVVVGARSAIFAPLDNIGAIIIDEEHEATYKQVVKEIADKIGLPFDMASLTWSQLQGLPVTTGNPASYQKIVEHGLDYPVPKVEPRAKQETTERYKPRASGQRSMTMRIIDTLFNGFGDEGGRNVALTRFVGLLFNKWVDCDLETAYELTKIANSVTVEPLPIDELDRTFSSIARAEYRKRG